MLLKCWTSFVLIHSSSVKSFKYTGRPFALEFFLTHLTWELKIIKVILNA